MRLVTFRLTPDAEPRLGVVDVAGDRLVDLTARLALDDMSRLIELTLDDPAVADRIEEWSATDGDSDLSSVTLDLPVARPDKILCIGVNYQGRSAEYADPADAPNPSVFIRFADSFVGHGAALRRPPESEQLDYEGEIVAVVGKGGRRIPRERAAEHLFGLSLANEGTVRDWVRHAKFNVTQGKNFIASGSIGPWIVAGRDLDGLDLADLALTTEVNGETRQHDTTASMKYPIAMLVSYLSTFTELHPGNLILTGTPMGAGARFDPPRWLVPGDVVDVAVEGVGRLSNPVADEASEASVHP